MNIALIAIIIANVLISYKGFNDSKFFRKYEFHIGSIRQGESIRLISSAFLHADINHLVFNMLTLYFFAPVVISYFAIVGFLLIYFVSIIFGSLLTFIFHGKDNSYSAIGASGAVTGILYSSILVRPDMMLGLYFIIPIPAYVFGILYLLYTMYGMKSKNDRIGHSAHFGGAIGGYLITLIINPQLIEKNSLMVVLLTVPIVILFVLLKFDKL